MVQLVALGVNPPTFDPVRSTLAGASLLGQQIQSATALESLRTAPERHALAMEQARRQSELAALQIGAAQRDQGALSAFQAQGGLGNPNALRALHGSPHLFTPALQGYDRYQTWRNSQIAQAAQRVLQAGPNRVQVWQQELENARSAGLIDPNRFAQLSTQEPSDTLLQALIDQARAPGAEPTASELARMQIGGPPPGGGQGQQQAPPGFGFTGLTPEALGLREQFGLTPPPDVQSREQEIARLRAMLADAGPQPGPPGVTAPPVAGAPGPPPPTVPPQAFSSPIPPGFYDRQSRRPDASVAAPTSQPPLQGQPRWSQGDVDTARGPVLVPNPDGSVQIFYQGGNRQATEAEIAAAGPRPGGGQPQPGQAPWDAQLPPFPAPGGGADPTRVQGWLGTAEGQPVLTSGPPSVPPPGGPPSAPPDVPGITLGQPGDAVGTPGANLLGGGGPPSPRGQPQTIGDAINQILGAPNVTAGQRARFWTLFRTASTRDDAMKFLQEIESGGAPLTASQRAERAASLRGEIRTIGSQFVGMQDAAGLIETALANLQGNPTTPGPWDVSMVINYMKMLDPASVVREGEYETARRTAGIPDQVWSWYQRAVSGAQLPASVRTEIGRVSRSLLAVRREDFLRMQRQYTGIAERIGINPQDVVLDLTRPDSAPGGGPPVVGAGVDDGETPSPPTDGTRRQLNGRSYVFRGGQWYQE